MKKLALTAIVIGASLFGSMPASADATTPTAHITITRGTSNCSLPGAGPKILGYPCSYPMGTRDMPLTRNALGTTDLPDGRRFHLTLREIQEAPNTPRKFKLSAHHRKNAAAELIPLAEITAKQNETFTFRFP